MEQKIQIPQMARQMLSNREMEAAVLNGLMNEREGIDQAMQRLSPYCFYEPRHQTIYHAITAVTHTPTFGEVQTVVETHILDFHEDIYGHEICIHFDAFLRDEMTFSSKDELILQLQKDGEAARHYFDHSS